MKDKVCDRKNNTSIRSNLFKIKKIKTMKKILFTLSLMSLMLQTTFAQLGSISQITISPANPTSNDSIYFYVSEIFSSSDCLVSSSSIGVVGNQVTASALHCIGPFTAICNTVDTFVIAPLPDGNYTFDMILSSGFSIGPLPCSPGIIPDTTASVNFTVSIVTDIEDKFNYDRLLGVYPNPSNGQLTIELEDNKKDHLVRIIAIDGRVIKELVMKKEKELITLNTGIYFLQLIGDQTILTTKKIVVLE